MPTTGKVLDGQVALVTGAGSGIGRAVAVELAKAGASVAVNYIGSEKGARETLDAIGDTDGRAIDVEADVSDEAEVERMFDRVCEAFGRIDILVSNAGIQKDAPLLEMTLADWNAVIGVNLTGQFLCAREAARRFVRQGVRPEVSCAAGKIVCMSSVHEVIPWAQHVNYAASKGGVMQLMKSMAQELAAHRIRVNSIAPGAIKTPINLAARDTPEKEKELLRLIPYGRIGEPEDVAKAAVWLASDASDYVHGSVLFVDGGMTLYPGFSEGGG